MGSFLINDDSDTPQPQGMRHPKRPVVGYRLSDGAPMLQGYDGLEVVYQLLTYAKMAKLESFFDPDNALVTITFDDPYSGNSITKNAVMQPVEIGGRTTMYFTDVVVRFTRLTPHV